MQSDVTLVYKKTSLNDWTYLLLHNLSKYLCVDFCSLMKSHALPSKFLHLPVGGAVPEFFTVALGGAVSTS